MIEDLDLLANRIRQLTALTQNLRTENAALCKSLAQRDSHIRMLRETVTVAQSRVDTVLARLPGAPEENEEGEPDPLIDDPASPSVNEMAPPAGNTVQGHEDNAESPPGESTESASAGTGARSLYGTS